MTAVLALEDFTNFFVKTNWQQLFRTSSAWIGSQINASAEQILKSNPYQTSPPVFMHSADWFASMAIAVTTICLILFAYECLLVDRGEFCQDLEALNNVGTDSAENANHKSHKLAEARVLTSLVHAIDFAAQAHGHQKRKASNLPYILHPIGVVRHLVDAGVYDLNTLMAAALHDVVEDTPIKIEDIVSRFGTHVAEIVAEVTDNKALSKRERKQHQIDSAAGKSKAAKLVKLADKLYNLNDLRKQPPPSWSLDRVQGYFLWAKATIDPMRGTNDHLEAQLDDLFNGTLIYNGMQTFCIAQTEKTMEEALTEYFDTLDDDDGKKSLSNRLVVDASADSPQNGERKVIPELSNASQIAQAFNQMQALSNMAKELPINHDHFNYDK